MDGLEMGGLVFSELTESALAGTLNRKRTT